MVCFKDHSTWSTRSKFMLVMGLEIQKTSTIFQDGGHSQHRSMLRMAAILKNVGHFSLANELFLINDPRGKHRPTLVLLSD